MINDICADQREALPSPGCQQSSLTSFGGRRYDGQIFINVTFVFVRETGNVYGKVIIGRFETDHCGTYVFDGMAKRNEAAIKKHQVYMIWMNGFTGVALKLEKRAANCLVGHIRTLTR